MSVIEELGSGRLPLTREVRRDRVPLSFAQERLWFLEQLGLVGSAYNIPSARRLCGELNVPALERSIGDLVARHESLRTRFAVIEGNAYQVIEESAPQQLDVHDLSALNEPARQARLSRAMQEEVAHRFDLTRGPLFRATLLRLGVREHVLLLTLHHIIADGWSMVVMYRELSALYDAYASARKSPLPRLPVQYADYAIWQRKWLQDDELQRQLSYWKDRLEGVQTLQLPVDRPRPSIPSFKGAEVSFPLPEALSLKLAALARECRVTLYMLLLAAFQGLLARLSQQHDVVVASPIAGRTHRHLERVIGFFANTLVLRTDVSEELSFLELLRRVKDVALRAYAYQDVPFEKLVAELHPERDLSRQPIFQVIFAWEDFPQPPPRLSGLTWHRLSQEITTAKFDLSLYMRQEPGSSRMHGSFEYATDLFDEASVQRLVGYWVRLLEAIVRDPQAKVWQIALLSEEEQRQIVHEWNAGSCVPAHECIHEWFEAQVVMSPDATAVVFEEQSLTYAELNARANQLAHYLRQRGVGPDVLVGLCVERSLEMVVGIVGILKAGGAYVPLDPGYPPERWRYVLADAAPRVLLTQASLKERWPATAAQLIALDTDWPQIAQAPDCNLDAQGLGHAPSDLAYVIYTSGSTGQPKGVMVEHRNVTRLFAATEQWFAFNSRDVWTLFHSFAFDFSVWELWGALLYGGRLVVVPQPITRTPQAFYELVCREGVTVLNQTPSAFRQLIAAQGQSASTHALRRVIFGGEALELRMLEDWYARHAADAPLLINMYGITETTVHVTYRVLSREDIARYRGDSSPIGEPIGDLRLYVLDAYQQPVPVGVVGEIYVGGAGVARGYLNRPELTAQRFVPDRFVEQADARMYRTGDVGRWRADGTLEYLGRNDSQVKVRGFRIELGEIEVQLRRHAQVKEALVLMREDVPGEKRLVAYVTAIDAEAPLQAEALRAHLKGVLPEYMVPSAYVLLERWPLTANGKLDRQALPAPDIAGQLQHQYRAACNALESTLCRIYAEVLKLERVGIDDNYFSLGGDSILSIKLAARAQAAGLDLTIADLFQYQTIENLAKALSQRQTDQPLRKHLAAFELLSAAERASLAADGENAAIEDAYPLSLLQAGMYFHTELDPASPIYHDVFSYRVEAPFRRDLFSQALQGLLQRHAVLRSCIEAGAEGRLLQIVHRRVSANLSIEDLTHLSAPAQLQAIEQWIAAEKHHRFNWTSAPLLRLFVQLRGPNQFQCSLSFHHIILDGWSVASLLTELLEHYQALLQGRPIHIPAPRSLYRDFIAHEQQALQSAATQDYWRQLLDEMTLPTTSSSLTNGLQPQGNGREAMHEVIKRRVTLDQTLTRQLSALARQQGVHVKALLLAAHIKVLSVIAGQQDITTGLVTNGRLEEPDGERALGLFLNSVPLRVKLADQTWRALICELHGLERSMLPHRRYPLAAVQEISGQKELFNTLFNFTRFHVLERLVHGLQISDILSFEQTNYALATNFSQSLDEGQLFLSLDYDRASFSTARIEDLSHYYLAALRALVSDVDAPHYRAPLLTEVDKQLLHELNATRSSYQDERCIHELFEERVKHTPETFAVVFEGRSLTYAELNSKANQLARYLNAQGIGPGQLVGIGVERSLEMVVGVLGVWKAGSAYVPLDPNYPAERLACILEDAAPAMLLTQSELSERLTQIGGQRKITQLCLDADWERIAAHAVTDLPAVSIGLTPAHLAYVIYTSGSTGQPKGAMIAHRDVVNLWHGLEQVYRKAGDCQRIALNASFNFDASVQQLVQLLSGRTLFPVPQQTRLDAASLLKFIDENGIEGIDCTPSQLRSWSLAGFFTSGSQYPRMVLVGGEAIDAELWSTLAHDAERHFFNVYGPTECTVDATFAEISSGAAQPHIGQPMLNRRVYILDAFHQLVPAGTAGEIYIGGDGVGRGYLNRPDLTAERFMADPLSDVPGARMYRTGDLGRWRSDRCIEYLGRNDSQVKVRGFRIELGEIEAQLRHHAQVKEALVLVREDVPGEKRLVAYVSAVNAEGLQTEALRAHLNSLLPEYMVPSAYVALERMPLTANGKLDRRALPAPDLSAIAHREYEAPCDEVEAALAQAWTEVLGVERVSRHDSFFELGGHSLHVIAMTEKLRRRGVNVDIRKAYSSPTLKDLAKAAEAPSHNKSTARSVSLTRIQAGDARYAPLFCVPGAGDTVATLCNLAVALGDDRPVYGFQPGSLERGKPFPDIPTAARAHIEEMLSIAPRGPYALLGYSFGGWIAFEMSLQLVERGLQVEPLLIIDSRSPHGMHDDPKPQSFRDVMRLLVGVFESRLRSSMGIAAEQFENANEDALLQLVLSRSIEKKLFPKDTKDGVLRNIVVAVQSAMSTKYVPARARVGGLVLVNSDHGGSADDPEIAIEKRTEGWKKYVDTVTGIRAPGSHVTMLEPPHVQVLAHRLSKYLRDS